MPPRRRTWAGRATWLLLGAAIAVAFGFAILFPALVVEDTPTYLQPARSWAAGAACARIESSSCWTSNGFSM